MNGSITDLPTPLVALLDRSAEFVCRASADMLEKIAAIDDAGLWREDGATSMTSWLAARYAMAWGVAREWVRVAHALRDLPAIRSAFAEGSLSFDQLKALTRFVTVEDDERWSRRA